MPLARAKTPPVRLVELVIPGRAEFVSLARLVVSSVAAERYALDDDQLDSLKLAVSEACVMVIDNDAPGDDSDTSPIVIECEGVADRIDVFVEGAVHELANAGDARAFPFIASLVDDAVLEPVVNGGSRVRMTLRCERAPEL